MKKAIIICGPTATGKTALGVKLAKIFNGEILSADSKQVYKGLDIGTGKDVAKSGWIDSQKKGMPGHYRIEGVKIWGYDLVYPKSAFSVYEYLKYAEKILKDIEKRSTIPIVVGGSGLYIKALISGISLLGVPKNNRLRVRLELLDTADLFENLAKLDSVKAASLNQSDRRNKRRLIRAVEVAQWRIDKKEPERKTKTPLLAGSNLIIGLSCSSICARERIGKRVQKRITQGIVGEVKSLISEKAGWKDQSMDSLGYRQWRDYFNGIKDMEETIKIWENSEYGYFKRQLTWFKKMKGIIWFDIETEDVENKIVGTVEKWYIKGNDQES